MAAERQNTSAFQEAPPPIIGIPSLLGRTWEHEPHLAREASSYDDLNILTEAHPRSSMWPPISLCTRHDSGAPTNPCIHDQDGNSSSTVSPATMTSGQWCLHAPVPSTTEVWVTKIKGNSIFSGRMVGQERRTVLAVSTSWSWMMNVVLTLNSYSYSELDYAGN